MSVATAALDAARQARRADAAAAAEHLRRREAELRANLAEAAAGRTALETRSQKRMLRIRTRGNAPRSILPPRTSARQRSKTCSAQETDRRASLDRKLSAAEAAHQEADTAARRGELAELQARYDAALAEKAAARAAFERQTAEAASALERVSRERVADAAAAAGQIAGIEAELGARLADAAAARTALERTLTEAQSAQQQAARRGSGLRRGASGGARRSARSGNGQRLGP